MRVLQQAAVVALTLASCSSPSVDEADDPTIGSLYVVTLAVSDYNDDRLDLTTPASDAAHLVARLEAESGDVYGSVHTRCLGSTDGEEVSRSALESLRQYFLEEADEQDTIIVFAAGLGARAPDGEYFLLTHEATPEHPERGIPRQQLESLVTSDDLRARRRVLLVHSVHAHEDDERRGVASPRGTDRPAPRPDDRPPVLPGGGGGIYVLACSSEFVVDRGAETMSVFMGALLDALDGGADHAGNRDRMSDIEELIDFTTRAVAAFGGTERVTMPSVIGGDPFPVARVR